MSVKNKNKVGFCLRSTDMLERPTLSIPEYIGCTKCVQYARMDKGRPLPKFGEWDVNDPASAEGFTVIFNKARDERKTGGNTPGPDSPGKDGVAFKHGAYAATKPNSKKWFCCLQASQAEA